MNSKYNTRSLALGIPGVLLQFVSLFLLMSNDVRVDSFEHYSSIGFTTGWILFVAGLCYYAAAKGYSVALGFVAGVFLIPGVLFLALLPDRTKTAGKVSH